MLRPVAKMLLHSSSSVVAKQSHLAARDVRIPTTKAPPSSSAPAPAEASASAAEAASHAAEGEEAAAEMREQIAVAEKLLGMLGLDGQIIDTCRV